MFLPASAASASFLLRLRPFFVVVLLTLLLSGAHAQTDNAAFVSQTPPPATVTAGQTYTVAVTMQNNGTATWTSGSLYRLGSEGYSSIDNTGIGTTGTDNTRWGFDRVEMPSSPVAPGQQAAFAFTVTAPTTPGTYPFQWRMVHDTVAHFGAFSPSVAVTVVPPPVISSLSPTSAAVSSGAFTLTVNGSGFTSNAIVKWNGTAQPTTFVSSAQLTAAIPASLVTTPGTVSITVTNPSLATSAPVSFTVTATPVISSLSPTSAAVSSGAFTLTVNGSNFATDGIVKWNGTAQPTTFVSTAKLTAAIPASLLTTAGPVPITVTNPHAATSGPATFTVFNPPTITSLSPTSRTAGSNFTLTVNGTNFASNSLVKWNGATQPTTFVSASQLTAAIPAQIVTTGQINVTVTNPSQATTDPTTFTVYPQFTLSVSPASVTGGTSATGTITTTDPAPPGMRFTLSDDSSSASVPSTVSVASGGTTATFTVTTTSVTTTTPVTITAQNSNTTHTATLTITPATATLIPPVNLAVYAIGSKRIRLYWVGVPGAIGYNVYRSIGPNGEIYSSPINSSPVTTTDTNPGITNTYIYTDNSSGLTDGTEYFYTVTAVYNSGQSGPSNEDSDVPDATAIPWDGTPSAITSAIRASESNVPGLSYPLDTVPVRVMGPDGTIYQEGNSTALAPDGTIDANDGTMTLSNGTVSATHFAAEVSSGQNTQILSYPQAATPSNIAGGGMRRVTSTLTGPNATYFTGSAGTYYLPSTMDSTYILANKTSDTKRDTPNIYLGMTSDAVEIDAGIQYHPANDPDARYANRWQSFIRVNDKLLGNTTKAGMGYGTYRVVANDTPSYYIYSDSLLGNDAEMHFGVNIHDHTALLVVYAYDYNGLYFASWYVAVAKGIFKSPLQHLKMKREVSLDQSIASDVAKGPTFARFTNAIDSSYLNPDGSRQSITTLGFVGTGSYMNNIMWMGGSLAQGTTLYPWASNYVYETYFSQFSATTPVTLSPASGDSQNETINIHN